MMDRISILPEDILHNIMSRLDHEEAVRTAVLSKSWRQTFSTFPYLVLNENHDAFIHSKQTNFFYNFVDNSLLRFLNQGLTLKKLVLWVDSTNHEKDLQLLYSRIDYWIQLAKDCAVEVLHITLYNDNYNRGYYTTVPEPEDDYAKRYHVPSSLLDARSLVKLILNGYILLDQAFLNHPITFSSLKVLSLCDVHITDMFIFRNLLTTCPLIEYITLDSVRGIDPVVSIQDLSKLKEVRIITGEIKMAEIEINAPSLQNFYYCGPYYTEFKMDKCVNLNELSLTDLNIISNQWFLQHHLFPCIRTLELKKVNMPARINMSLPQLKVLKLDNCYYGLREEAYINIDAPKLYMFTYISSQFNKEKIDFLNSSSQLEIRAELSFHWILDYRMVREFFQQFEGRNVSATLSFFNVQRIVSASLS
ncbi:hypothetical protein RIF29_40900 [Crotalaria pallida]|uniref:F-box domain-containing protein n=1 Tax=Crotalaria pallida TaxID=3830 RepID=A0AAN9E3Y5_CROPI